VAGECDAVLETNKQYLTELDSPIGDADHGINMDRGSRRSPRSCPPSRDGHWQHSQDGRHDVDVQCRRGQRAVVWHVLYEKWMAVVSKEELTNEDLVELLANGVDGILQRGGAA